MSEIFLKSNFVSIDDGPIGPRKI